MAQYNLGRFDPTIQTPRTTRYNQQRGQDGNDSSSDSSIKNQRWRDNYPRVANFFNAMKNDSETGSSSESSSCTGNSEPVSSGSSQNNNQRIQFLEHQIPDHVIPSQESNSSPDAAIPVINDGMSTCGSDHESADQSGDEWREDLRQQLFVEQDDEYASEDDLVEYQHIVQDPVINANAPQNRLQDMLADDAANDVINAQVNVTVAEILLPVMKYSFVHNLSQSAIADLFKMLNIYLGTSILPQSRYLVDKMFNFEDHVDYHALCPNCKNYVTQFDREQDHCARCDPCDIEFSLNDPTYTDFFCIINSENEIALHLEENWSYYESVVEARAANRNDINDFHSGLLYEQLRNSLPDYKKDQFVTVTFNSDGSPVFGSSTFSIWPIQIIVNELPFKLRTSKPIVCGLWFGKNKPNMDIFFEPFVTQMNRFANEGITCNVRDAPHTIYIYAICSCDDSVARAPMQGLTQFNGFYECNWCLHPGYYIRVGRGGSVKYILLDERIHDRNDVDTLRHMREAVESGRSVNGLMNESILTRLSHFNIISGFVPDPMHCSDLGVGKQFIKYWLDTRNMPYSLTNAEIVVIDNALTALKVPSKLVRNSRSIRDRKHWKAKELQNWILYYSTIALLMIPRMRCYAMHWSYFVRAYYILLQNNINREQILEAHRLLTRFVALTEFYYSRSAMTFNIHQLLHLAQSVVNWGSLHYHSGYGFENGNGQIVKQIHAAKGVLHQICKVIGMRRSELILTKFMLHNDPDSVVLDYVRYLEKKECVKVLKTNNGRYFGAVTRPPARWVRELNLSDSAVVYKKLVRMECTYLSCNTVRLRSNNSFAQTVDNIFIQMVFFIVDRLNRQEYTVCQNVNVIDIPDNNDHFHEFQIKRVVTVSQDFRAIDTSTIDRICVFMDTANESYLCPVPNMYSY